MSDQLDVFEATVRRFARWRPPKLAPPAPPLVGPRDSARWATWLLDEYVAACSSERSCRCRGLHAEDPKEKFALLERSAYHLRRMTDLRAQLLAHTTYPELAPMKNAPRAP